MSFGLALNVDTDVSVFAGLASRAWMDPAAAREVGGAQEVCICEEGILAPAVQFNCRYGTKWSTCVCATVTCKRIEECAHLFWLENVVLLLRAAKREGQVRLCFVRLGLSLVWEGWGVVDTLLSSNRATISSNSQSVSVMPPKLFKPSRSSSVASVRQGVNDMV